MNIALQQPSCFIVTVGRLKRILASISMEDEHWWALPPTPYRTKVRLYIAYRNLHDRELINDVAYSFPIIAGEAREGDALVCIHPEALEAEYVGLYIEPDGLKQDCFEDFQRLCLPILEALEWEFGLDGFSLYRCACLKDLRPEH